MVSHEQRACGFGTFAELFERYKNLVYKTAYLMLQDPGEAEEALQEVFVLVFKSLSTFDPQKGAFTTWVYRITINYCLSQRRKHRLSLRRLDSGQPSISVESPVSGLGEREVVRQAIGRLSDRQRSVIVLRFYWDLPYAEIAKVLDIPLGTVKSRINLALHTLRHNLAEEEAIEAVRSSFKEAVLKEECEL